MDEEQTRCIAEELVALLGTDKQVESISRRYDGFNLTDAYKIATKVCTLRLARGEIPIGRKIGFTNQAVRDIYGVSAPIWNYVFDRTVRDSLTGKTTFDLGDLPEPLIEPEVALHLATAPSADMNERELLACIDWVSAGFEIVYSIFPGWKFSLADATAAYGVHGALVIGRRCTVLKDAAHFEEQLSSFNVELTNDQGVVRRGEASNVLGGPLCALRYLVDEISRYPDLEPLRAGELITTGTLTEAMPAIAGETWCAKFSGIDLEPLQLEFA